MSELRDLMNKAHDEAMRLRKRLIKTEPALWQAKEILLDIAQHWEDPDPLSFEHIRSREALHEQVRQWLLTVPDQFTVADLFTGSATDSEGAGEGPSESVAGS